MNELAAWLTLVRKEAKLSLGALSEKTKIMEKHLAALESGDAKALPTAVHVRAFALAFARACGVDDEEALEQVSAALSSKAAAPLKPVPVELPRPEPEASRNLAVALSSPLPWKLWGMVAFGALAFLFLLHMAVSCVRRAAPAPAALAASQVTPAAPEPISGTAVAAEELSLRSRRPCWVILMLDGKRLPVIFLEPDKRERWSVKSKAVMLAGNIGAVRVWWRGDNLGYFGALGERMNGIVFETGKAWRRDSAEDLPLPQGVPSQPGK